MKLYTAIVKEIKEKKKFSAYDITKSIREKVNDNNLNVDDAADLSFSSGKVTKEIPHNEVNNILNEIFNHQIVSLKRSYSTSGDYYFIYEVITTNPVAAAISAINPNANKLAPVVMTPISGPKPLNTSMNRISSGFSALTNNLKALGTVSSPTVDPVKAKVKSYVESKKKKNQVPTLWNIQKAIKSKGTKVSTIANICSTLGYSVIKKSSFYRSEVK